MLRLMAPIRFATAKTVVAGAVAGGILFGSQLVMAAAPTADFDFTPGVGRVGQPVSFSASTEDPDDDIVSVEWDFENDGTFDDAGENVQHTYSSSGTRTVRMVVTDATSDTAVVFDTIRVNAPPNAAFDFSPVEPDGGPAGELRRLGLDRRRRARRRQLRLGLRRRRRLRRRERAPGRPLLLDARHEDRAACG